MYFLLSNLIQDFVNSKCTWTIWNSLPRFINRNSHIWHTLHSRAFLVLHKLLWARWYACQYQLRCLYRRSSISRCIVRRNVPSRIVESWKSFRNSLTRDPSRCWTSLIWKSSMQFWSKLLWESSCSSDYKNRYKSKLPSRWSSDSHQWIWIQLYLERGKYRWDSMSSLVLKLWGTCLPNRYLNSCESFNRLFNAWLSWSIKNALPKWIKSCFTKHIQLSIWYLHQPKRTLQYWCHILCLLLRLLQGSNVWRLPILSLRRWRCWICFQWNNCD